MPPQNLIYLFSAYTIIWLVLFGYLVFLHGQLGDLRSQVSALRKRQEAGPAASTKQRSTGKEGGR